MHDDTKLITACVISWMVVSAIIAVGSLVYLLTRNF